MSCEMYEQWVYLGIMTWEMQKKRPGGISQDYKNNQMISVKFCQFSRTELSKTVMDLCIKLHLWGFYI